ncbi:L-ascorbate metabolism protein UlaG (beta-lactamase superfamily) [Chitinophaga niastensis]|uniref:L-ascorbate metabolism protein UlaG (Beta-lactamase superfamily) n=1 Tax=Chitinophaga niastensis TaxID=536980 RepID=A0A2P8HIY8_CHINA|nr:MBL fold metallo-hydrolase [Chitinophaga niastensis]PSL46140.1 L-ascorbate metabolism protein UlaG (beta-lactamase superfamily) [Chitinophaga niastensis]
MKPLKISLLIICVALAQISIAQSRKSFQWIGGPTYALQLGSFKILTDPMLSPKSDTAFMIKKHPTTGALNAYITRYADPASFDTAGIDLLLISHPHADHFDREGRQKLNKQLSVVAPAVNKDMLLNWGFVNTHGLNWGDTMIINKSSETLRIIAVKAMHTKDEPLRTELGKGNGYIVEYTNGSHVYRIYWTGDTVWFDEIQDLTRYGKINLLVPDMGAVGSDGKIGRRGLNADDCLKIIKALNPDLISPVHHSTFSMYVEPISILQHTLDATGYRKRLKIIEPGAIIKL